MGLGIVDRVNYGHAGLEPVVLGLMAMNKSFMLIGRHGSGKTRMARVLSRGYGEKGFVFYDATKDDLITVAGIPDPEGLKNGKLRFVGHERSIWGKSTVVVDEITRAGRESQNLWLEILEERTCFGLPLAYRTLIATANPESYAAAFQLDDALLDRFHAVVPVPEMQAGVQESDVRALVKISANETPIPDPGEIARVFVEIQAAHARLVQQGSRDILARYLGRFVPILLEIMREQNGPYISARTYSRNLPETILAIAAYFEVDGSAEPLVEGTKQGLNFALATKIQIKPSLLEQIHKGAESLLRHAEAVPGEKLRMDLTALSSFEERLTFIREHWHDLQSSFHPDEMEKYLGDLLRGATQKGEQEKLVVLRDTLEGLDYRGDALRQVDGRLLVTLNSAINYVVPKLAKLAARDRPQADAQAAIDNIRRFQALLTSGKLLATRTPEVSRIKAFLIALYERQQPTDEDSLVAFFSTLALPPE
jgi:MoxR-like ATPase